MSIHDAGAAGSPAYMAPEQMRPVWDCQKPPVKTRR